MYEVVLHTKVKYKELAFVINVGEIHKDKLAETDQFVALVYRYKLIVSNLTQTEVGFIFIFVELIKNVKLLAK